MAFRIGFMGLFAACLLWGCQNESVDSSQRTATNNSTAESSNTVSEAVKTANAKTAQYLDFTDRKDFEHAERGFIATLEDPKILRDDGRAAYDLEAWNFLDGEIQDTVNPSLWRQGQLAKKHGLFKVTDGIYQVRNFDLSNITFIEGDTGWIVVDTLLARETAAKAKELVDRELGERPISAILFTHSHTDHYGGVRGLISEADIERGVPIIAPDNFVFETVAENILAGNAMGRRVSYMFGGLLPKDAEHQVGVGLGQGVSSGTPGLLQPTKTVTETGQKLVVDGVEMEFIMALESEAPSEFMFYMPKYKAFSQAEVINHTLHNMYTPRGAQVRDGRLWSRYIDEAIDRFGDKTDVSFGSHHWPVWGADEVTDFWEGQRDVYRYIHDQTVRLANMGHTMHEIPELLNIPDGIAKRFANRDYYGTVSHNAKSQYQLYFGYFDGNPANLDPLPPTAESKKFVEYMGGAEAILENAKADYDDGEFRFVATALNKLVFAQPENMQARNLLADTYTQLAYMAESGSWRNFYLTGALELREGIKDLPVLRTSGPDSVAAVPLNLYFDFLAVRLNGPEAAKKDFDINFVITDTGETAHLFVSNGTLHHRMGKTLDGAPTINITRPALDQLNLKQKTFDELVKDGSAEVKGNPSAITEFFNLIEEPEFWFEIVRP